MKRRKREEERWEIQYGNGQGGAILRGETPAALTVLTANETLFPTRPYVLMRDFVPVAMLNYSELLMVVHPSVPAKTLQEFIALAKAKPGKLNYASAGAGTPYHMAAELFKKMTGTDIVHVPHKAAGDSRNDVIGGHIQMMFCDLPPALELIRSGKLRALGVTTAQRVPAAPESCRSPRSACRASTPRPGTR